MADPSETTQVSRESTTRQDDVVAALRALAAQVGSLQADVQALRSESRGLPAGDSDRHGWDESAPIVREGPAWVRSVDAPRPRRLPVPWLVLEAGFLVAVAVLAIVADLEPYAIASVMVVAWLLVALSEWLAARGERHERELVYRAATPVTPPTEDRTWLAANGDETLLDAPPQERPPARLPPPD